LGCHNSVGLQWAELQSGVAVSRLAKLRTSNPGRGPHSIIGPIAVKDAEPGDVVEIRLIPHSPDEAAILSALTDVQG
jgi:acetamidase/formamidase